VSYRRGLGKPGRRLSDISAREVDLMREVYDERELARYERELEAREPRQDPRVDPDFTDWLTDTEDAA
jgi:hypothetical protein